MKKIIIILIFLHQIHELIGSEKLTKDIKLKIMRRFFIPSPTTNPIHFIASQGYTALLKALIESGDYHVDQSDELERTPLHYAALNGKSQTVRTLLGLGAEPYVKDLAGKIPADLAALNGHHEISTELIISTGLKFLNDVASASDLDE